MSSPDPGRDVWADRAVACSSPVAWISRSALSANARLAWGDGLRLFSPSIVEADAWGHGAGLVSEVLASEGFVPAEEHRRSSAARDSPPPVAERGATLSPETLFGLPGGSEATRPALRLTGTVLSVKDLRAGEGVSYGFAYRAPVDTRVALVTGGYAQGIVRALGGTADVAIAGERHPIVGRVAMDVCVVEIQDAAARRADDVLFLGDPAREEPSLAGWVRGTGLRPAELITTVGLRAIRREAP
ncbi:alanine racemase [Microbacterium sp. HD4P20]|uniref:alanine racemase C-terminal domain-containing protein n=1 Tax=Microbacterium sp. HD4P20 TaxID=2864874 RepID=UPI0020A4D581|nr:alanine racemase C-terminal domain-containing protein [Microbacterium sp. HD4P20]MCP2636867.1 alanine racemase [Microbacterium sp. HD4P20]